MADEADDKTLEQTENEPLVLADEPDLAADFAQEQTANEEETEEVTLSGSKEVPPQEGIQDLKKRLEAEKAARVEAERQAYEARLHAQRHQAEAQDSNYQMVLSAISTVEQRAVALRGAYAESMTAGDYEKAAQIQEAIALNTGHLSELQRGKKAMEDASRQPVKPVEPPQDPIEQWAQSVTPRSANWLRAHRNALSSEAMQKRVLLAHSVAQDEGLEPDSDAYFHFIEQQVGLRKRAEPQVQEYDEPTADSPLSAAAAPTPRRSPPPPAAPVSRGAPRGNAVRLTANEREAARISGLTEEEYARNKERIRQAGRA